MIGSIQNNASALNAFTNQMQTSANNVANALTDGYKGTRAVNVEGDPQGVSTVYTRDERSGPLKEDPVDGSLIEGSNTSITDEIVNQIAAQNGFDANAQAIKTQEETLGTLIDVVG